jgi:predicted dehydrogenase
MVKFAVLGYGFMGNVHINSIKKNRDAKVVAVVESYLSKLKEATKGNLDNATVEEPLQGVEVFATMDEMLEKVDVDCVSICLPTHLHKEYAVKALNAGKHVVCEKPMALSLEECDAMINAAEKNNKKLLVAQCIRFWPEYAALKNYVESGDLGKPVSMMFRRVSASPFWAGPKSWFADPKKSGGCVFDLHVHDVDFLNYLFGKPESVFSQGFNGQSGGNEAVITQYNYKDGPLAVAEGSWAYPVGFKMAYTALFEKGKLEYDSYQEPHFTLTRLGKHEPEELQVPEGDGYDHEYDYFIDSIKNDSYPAEMTPQSARDSIKIAIAEARSIESGSLISL